MTVAVTGGTGFVGSHLVEALRRAGRTVRCLARDPAAAAELQAAGCEVVRGGLDDPPALSALARGTEALFHVAGAVAARDEEGYLRVNRDGTERVVAAAREAGLGRLVYVSSLSVTGPAERGRPRDEAGPPRPVTPYGRSKAAGEEVVRSGGVPFTIVRPPVVYGPRDRQVLRLFRLARRGFVPVLGDGGQELSLVHAADLADAIVAAATSARTLGGTYHAGHPEPLTQRQLASVVAAAVGRRAAVVRLPEPIVRGVLRVSGAAARMAGRTTLLSPEKAAEILAPAWTCSSEALARDAGWRAATAHSAGFARTAAWYRSAGWL